jgi:hypothetical protein
MEAFHSSLRLDGPDRRDKSSQGLKLDSNRDTCTHGENEDHRKKTLDVKQSDPTLDSVSHSRLPIDDLRSRRQHAHTTCNHERTTYDRYRKPESSRCSSVCSSTNNNSTFTLPTDEVEDAQLNNYHLSLKRAHQTATLHHARDT